MPHISALHGLAAAALACLAAVPSPAGAQTPPPLDLATRATLTTAAARSLVPLLRDVRKRTARPVVVEPGGSPDSPFTGTQTTLFAFTVSKRSIPVDPGVVKAIDRLLAWNIDDPAAVNEAELFDEWLDQLSIKTAGLVTATGFRPCDTACVVRRMTSLDDTWGPTARERAESRDELLLDALIAAVSAAR